MPGRFKRWKVFALLTTISLGSVHCGIDYNYDELCEFMENMFGGKLFVTGVYSCKGDTFQTSCVRAAKHNPSTWTCMSGFSKYYNENGGEGDTSMAYLAYAKANCQKPTKELPDQNCLRKCDFSRKRCIPPCVKVKVDVAACQECYDTCNKLYFACNETCRPTK